MNNSKRPHSIKVPKLYKVATQVAKECSEGKGSIKHLVLEKRDKHRNIKAIYALVSKLFQRHEILDNLLKKSKFLSNEPHCDPWLMKVLMVELLWGKGGLPGQSKPEATIRAYEQIFKAHLSDQNLPDLTNTSQEISKPRYVRVNTLKTDFNRAVNNFCDEGWNLLELNDKSDYNEFLEKVSNLKEGEFLIDIHVPNLLVFPPKTEFYNHVAYKKGLIILQDKASCFPVYFLSPAPGSTVLDMCAAPGMKTTHLAAVMNDEGKIYAVERSPQRFEVLNTIVESSGTKCIETVCRDIINCDSKDFPGVEYILVDPSCTGSGMTGRNQNMVKADANRLKKLSGFQIVILRSALIRYPRAKRVVYSTCSVYPEENEDVVRQVLETNYNFKLVPATDFLNNNWKNVGSSSFGDIGKYCLYAKPRDDLTNGFFVAVFERLKEGETNQFYNEKIFNFKKNQQLEKTNKEVGDDNSETRGGKPNQRNNNNNNSQKNIKVKENVTSKKITQEIKDHSGKEKFIHENVKSEKKVKKKLKKKSPSADKECAKEIRSKVPNENQHNKFVDVGDIIDIINKTFPDNSAQKTRKKKSKKSISSVDGDTKIKREVEATIATVKIEKNVKSNGNESHNSNSNSENDENVVMKNSRKTKTTEKDKDKKFLQELVAIFHDANNENSHVAKHTSKKRIVKLEATEINNDSKSVSSTKKIKVEIETIVSKKSSIAEETITTKNNENCNEHEDVKVKIEEKKKKAEDSNLSKENNVDPFYEQIKCEIEPKREIPQRNKINVLDIVILKNENEETRD